MRQKRSTGPSRVVPHRSTTPARTCLTALFGWEAVSQADMAALFTTTECTSLLCVGLKQEKKLTQSTARNNKQKTKAHTWWSSRTVVRRAACSVDSLGSSCTGACSAATSAWLTASHPNSEVKLVRAGVVLRWGTTREGPVLRFSFLHLPFHASLSFSLERA